MLLLGLEFYWIAFWELSSCRQVGFGFGPIPWSALHDYAMAYELDADEAREFIYLLREMDGVWCDWQTKRADKTEPKKLQR